MIPTSFYPHSSDTAAHNTRTAGRLEESPAGIEESAQDESSAGDD